MSLLIKPEIIADIVRYYNNEEGLFNTRTKKYNLKNYGA